MSEAQENTELFPLNLIRTETVISRFPIHRLSKRGYINIEIKETNADGELRTRWKVSYNSEYGQPGAFEYKLDTLLINRRIEETGQPVPTVVLLGSLRDIADELSEGHTGNTNYIKKALLRNAFAGINLKRTYTSKDGTEKKVEAAFTRYSLVFTGERLPDGRTADAVYLVLNEIYREILNTAPTRPLDYDYLKELSPGAQRFYELLSYQIFASLRNARPRAKMLYSYYCARAPQTRYLDYEHVKKQMYKLHAPHKKSDYISTVELRETTDSEGQPDWEMLYTPGQRAKAEFREATKPRTIQRPKQTPAALSPATTEPKQPPAQIVHKAEQQDLDPLVTKLIGFHITEATARELVRDYRKSVELQLRALPYRNTNKIKGLAAWLIKAIRENYELPEEMKTALKKETEAKRQVVRKETETARQKRRDALQPAYYEFLRAREGKHKKERRKAYSAFLEQEAGQRAEIEDSRVFKPKFKAHQLAIFDQEETHLDRLREHFKEPTLDEWLEQIPDTV